jgi:hypothetical protein
MAALTQANAWLSVPKGTCEKIISGSLSAKNSWLGKVGLGGDAIER